MHLVCRLNFKIQTCLVKHVREKEFTLSFKVLPAGLRIRGQETDKLKFSFIHTGNPHRNSKDKAIKMRYIETKEKWVGVWDFEGKECSSQEDEKDVW